MSNLILVEKLHTKEAKRFPGSNFATALTQEDNQVRNHGKPCLQQAQPRK
jgi:hypothetical protein